MVYISTSDEWQRQSALLLQARPSTTRITTKYNVPNLAAARFQKSKKRKLNTEGEEKESDGVKVPRAFLTLKTYDPESGVVLKFKTDRAAEVGRLINGLGHLSRHMAALPEKVDVVDAAVEDVVEAAAETAADSKAPSAGDAKANQTSAGGGGKKKKKSKR